MKYFVIFMEIFVILPYRVFYAAQESSAGFGAVHFLGLNPEGEGSRLSYAGYKGSMVLEICVDSVESAIAAQSGGAQRVELCSSLIEGGVTPSSGLIGAVRECLSIPVITIVRPRGGDFFYSGDEFAVMKKDITVARNQGANGVALGVLLRDGQVDIERTRELVELARPMEVTFHRAIDWALQMEDALEQVIEAGADRILTSGGAQTAMLGVHRIARMVAKADRRIGVMVCGTVRKENIGEIARRTNACEFHASLRKPTGSPVSYRNQMLSLSEPGVDEFTRYAVAAEDVRALRDALRTVQEVDLARTSPPRL
jgi:copper homeostasis protein